MTRSTEQTEHWNRCLEKVGTSQDKSAFAELIRHYAPMVKAYMLKADSITHDVAEKLVQGTMIRLWQRAPEFLTSRASASSWIFSIARNFRYSWQYQQTSRVSKVVNVEKLYHIRSSLQESASGEPNGQDPELRLDRLTEEQLAVLQMVYHEGKTIQEVADALDLPLINVKSYIKLALKTLKI